MVELYKQLIGNQYEACLRMLWEAIERCPDDAWEAPVANHAFCQAAFHTLIATDIYLGPNLDALKQQAFHKENAPIFGDYEDLEDKEPEQMHERADVVRYFHHCRAKAREAVAAETPESLAGPSGFPWLDREGITRAELHVYNIRHIHHHAAQMSLRARLDGRAGIPWCKSRWDAVVSD